MDKEKVTLQLLMADASSYYTKLEANKHAQIIALTTQILELKHAMSQVKTSPKPSADVVNTSNLKKDGFSSFLNCHVEDSFGNSCQFSEFWS